MGPVLISVHVRFEVDWTRPDWIEDELIRGGARDAHMIQGDDVAVTVAARSRAEANQLVEALLARVGATAVEILKHEPALSSSRS